MFVSVVYKQHEDSATLDSRRNTGGWEAFLAYDKEDAIEKAQAWQRIWENELSTRTGKPRQYTILIGELTEEAKAVRYELVELD